MSSYLFSNGISVQIQAATMVVLSSVRFSIFLMGWSPLNWFELELVLGAPPNYFDCTKVASTCDGTLARQVNPTVFPTKVSCGEASEDLVIQLWAVGWSCAASDNPNEGCGDGPGSWEREQVRHLANLSHLSGLISWQLQDLVGRGYPLDTTFGLLLTS